MAEFAHEYSNKSLELAPEVIIVPKIDHIEPYKSPEEIVNQLNELESPGERVKSLLKECFLLGDMALIGHEASWIRSLAITSFFGGGFLGALFNSRDLHAQYIRKHNASVFQNQFTGNRHFWDTLVSGMVPRALNYGFKTSLLTTSASLLCISSVTYRGKLYAPDWIIGFTTIGGLSRLWLGPRAIAAGALFGGTFSMVAYGLVRSIELSTGHSLAQLRLLNHREWLIQRENKRYRNLLAQQAFVAAETQLPETDSFKLDIEG